MKARFVNLITMKGFSLPFALFTLMLCFLSACSPTRDAAAIAKEYDSQLVRRPGSAVEDDKVYFVKGGKKLWITDKSWILSHGFHWPADVKVIPADDLAVIPAGDELH